MYHKIGTPKGTGLCRNLYVRPWVFRMQMWYLKIAGFRVVPIDDIVHLAKGSSAGGKLIALTFDDGFRNFHDYALPVLRKFGYPATVYVVTDLIGKHDAWEDFGDAEHEPLMTWDEIETCRQHGITIGSHTKTHPRLSGLSPEQVREEVFGSRQTLEERLDVPVRHFCYPSGDYNQAVAAAVADAGYVSAVTTRRGRVHAGDNLFELPRTFIRRITNPFLFLIRLHTDYEDRKARRS